MVDMESPIWERLQTCIRAALESENVAISPEMSLTEDLNMESMHLVSLQVEIEEAFGIEFDPLDDDFFHIFQTVNSVYQTIAEKLA